MARLRHPPQSSRMACVMDSPYTRCMDCHSTSWAAAAKQAHEHLAEQGLGKGGCWGPASSDCACPNPITLHDSPAEASSDRILLSC
ncbi:hypothetical protein HaLaN_04661 [Haematococcus lacustris]|uniref:Uncharacterized protein n=1 Tax=Haematococcus lacustris TaxID=44745 RepID=A0A699YRU1_HAELA|nr:hypothetical protein HaLaN_04661 [Haematococcus lacustris]